MSDSELSVDVEARRAIEAMVLAAVIDQTAAEKLRNVTLEPREVGCIRARVAGRQNSRDVEHTVDCLIRTPRGGGSMTGLATATPASVAAQMLAFGVIRAPGVWGPESAIEPDRFFRELAKRQLRFELTTRSVLSD